MSAWSDEDIADVRRLAAMGLSAGQIAAKLPRDVSRNAVIGLMRRANIELARGGKKQIPPRPQPKTHARKAVTGPKPMRGAVAQVRKAGMPNLPTGTPMRFAEAVERERCLYFTCDPMSPDGPDMPVCGAERATGIVMGRYCARHILLSYQEKAA